MITKKLQKKIATSKPSSLTWFEKDLLTPHNVQQALWGVIIFYTGNPILIDWACRVIREFDIPERDNRALVNGILKYTQDNIKYFRESPERFASPLRTIEWGIGDCDDKSILIATVLRSFKLPIRLKFLRFTYFSPSEKIKKTVQHVYPQVKLENKWYSLESVHKWPAGKDAEKMLNTKGIKSEVSFIGDV